MGYPLNERQVAVLEWIAGGCRAGEEPVERHKQSAVALANRRLILLDRVYEQPWRARLTPLGRYWLEHRAYPPDGTMLEPLIETDSDLDGPGDGLSDAEFINRRRVLKADWAGHGPALSRLRMADQWVLHGSAGTCRRGRAPRRGHRHPG